MTIHSKVNWLNCIDRCKIWLNFNAGIFQYLRNLQIMKLCVFCHVLKQLLWIGVTAVCWDWHASCADPEIFDKGGDMWFPAMWHFDKSRLRRECLWSILLSLETPDDIPSVA